LSGGQNDKKHHFTNYVDNRARITLKMIPETAQAIADAIGAWLRGNLTKK